MVKKVLIPFIFLAIFTVPLKAQNFHVSISYQSFRPFVHFQLDFGQRIRSSPYRTAYLKGYMDGVNSNYYYDHRFEEMVENIQIYKAGYRDGLRDRSLIIRLRGRRWLNRHCFTYQDYYSPYTSVRVWLEGITFAFVKAPPRRLPPGWRHKIDPRVKKYRKWLRKGRKRVRKYHRKRRKRIRKHRKWERKRAGKRFRRHRRWRSQRGFDDYEEFDDYEDYYEEFYEEYEDD